jgi:hypothetical protein
MRVAGAPETATEDFDDTEDEFTKENNRKRFDRKG